MTNVLTFFTFDSSLSVSELTNDIYSDNNPFKLYKSSSFSRVDI